jgi:uncharacterized protein (TIGR00251 family)
MSTKKVKVRVHPNSSQEKIEENKDFFEVWMKEKPIDGKANEKLVKILKKYFKKGVIISSGFNSRVKYLEVED